MLLAVVADYKDWRSCLDLKRVTLGWRRRGYESVELSRSSEGDGFDVQEMASVTVTTQPIPVATVIGTERKTKEREICLVS